MNKKHLLWIIPLILIVIVFVTTNLLAVLTIQAFADCGDVDLFINDEYVNSTKICFYDDVVFTREAVWDLLRFGWER